MSHLGFLLQVKAVELGRRSLHLRTRQDSQTKCWLVRNSSLAWYCLVAFAALLSSLAYSNMGCPLKLRNRIVGDIQDLGRIISHV